MLSSYSSPSSPEMCQPTTTPSPLSSFPGREEVGEAPLWLTPPRAWLSHPHSHTHGSCLGLSHTGCLTLTSSNTNTKATGHVSQALYRILLPQCLFHTLSLPHTCACRHLFFFCLFLFGIGGSFREQGSVLFTRLQYLVPC